ncbi:hypothetical protein, partial [Bacillus sp. GbtcB10]|uniref:hypothetical protein n=1 Tax=Bacillus sp. GbtcB10 TaxID=2824755 RepID=UPI001C30759C
LKYNRVIHDKKTENNTNCISLENVTRTQATVHSSLSRSGRAINACNEIPEPRTIKTRMNNHIRNPNPIYKPKVTPTHVIKIEKIKKT